MFKQPIRPVVCVVLSFAVGRVAAGQKVEFAFAGEDGKLSAAWKAITHPLTQAPKWSVVTDRKLGRIMRGESNRSSGGLARATTNVSLQKTPWLNFTWKVEKHPAGSVAVKGKSDQAMIIYVDFGRPSGLFSKRRELAYLFDSRAKPGSWHDDSTLSARVQAKVVDSGKENLGKWLSRSVDVAADFRARFGSAPPPVVGVSVYCNSNNSSSSSIGYCSRLTFSANKLYSNDD